MRDGCWLRVFYEACLLLGTLFYMTGLALAGGCDGCFACTDVVLSYGYGLMSDFFNQFGCLGGGGLFGGYLGVAGTSFFLSSATFFSFGYSSS